MLKSEYRIIGMMSGTSLDGLDLCYCSLSLQQGQWHYSIDQAETIAYPEAWLQRLHFKPGLSAEALLQLNHDYGELLAEYLQQFMAKYQLSQRDIDLIASHGHTFYHRPETGFSYQLGGGPEIFARTGMTCVSDFRSQDIALGGQGAPLVPLVDRLLFGHYEACLNLGGFANISFEGEGRRLAFDICPLNFVLNRFAAKLALPYDKDGAIARAHQADARLLEQLNQLAFYNQDPPKSLGAEWVHEHIYPLIASQPPEVLLATFSEHSARQIASTLHQNNIQTCLLSGGGAFNSWLIERIKAQCKTHIVVPDAELINYKEALAFGLLGVLRQRGEVNVLASVTGARTDHSAGILYH